MESGNEMRHQLKNVQHEFSVAVGEVGVTIRRGFKWATVKRGTQVDLIYQHGPAGVADVAEEFRGTAEIVGHWVGKLKDLPARVIELEHEPSSRLYGGLVSSLKRGYGDVDENEYFTAVFYRRLSIAGQQG